MDVITTKGKHLAPAEPVKTGSFRKMLPLILMIAALLVVGTMGSFALLTQSGAPVRNLFKAAPRFMLQYDDNVADEDISVPASSTVYDPAQFKIDTSAPGERAGWEFTGWNTAADGSGTSYAVGDTVMLTEAEVASGKTVKLYAQWRELYKVNVSYDKNTTDNVTGMPANETIRGQSSDVSVTLGTAPSREGYEFAGWNTAADGSGTSYTAGQEITVTIPSGENEVPLNLYAQWDKIYSYTLYVGLGSLELRPLDQDEVTNIPVEWTWDGGPCCYSITKEQAGDTCDFVLPTNIPEVNGGLFMGYRSEGSNAQNYGPGGTVTVPREYEYGGTVSLQMQWLNGDYAVIYDPNGGTGAPQPSTAVDAADQHLFNIAAAPDSMTKNIPGTTTAMTFLGWADTPDATAPQYSADGTSVSAEVQSGLETTITLQRDVAQVKTLYAVWGFEYRLHFDEHADIGGNWSGAEGHVQPADMVSFSAAPTFTMTIPEDTPERPDYYFAWWSENEWHAENESSADVTSHQPTEAFAMRSTNPSLVLYARYRPAKPLNLTFAANNWKSQYYTSLSNMPAAIQKSVAVDKWYVEFALPSNVPTVSTKSFTVYSWTSYGDTQSQTFLGWALSSTATEPDYLPDEIYSMDVERFGQTPLYGVWENRHAFSLNCGTYASTGGYSGMWNGLLTFQDLNVTEFDMEHRAVPNSNTDYEILGWSTKGVLNLGMGEEVPEEYLPLYGTPDENYVIHYHFSVSSCADTVHEHRQNFYPVYRRIPAPHSYRVNIDRTGGNFTNNTFRNSTTIDGVSYIRSLWYNSESYIETAYFDTAMEVQSLTFPASVFNVLGVTREGYMLKGWGDAPNGEVKYHVGEDGRIVDAVTVDNTDRTCSNAARHQHTKTIYAIWEPLQTFEVWFGANAANGRSAYTDQTNTEDSHLFAAGTIGPAMSKAGYAFMGWADSEEKAAAGTVDYAVDSNQKITTDITVSKTDSHAGGGDAADRYYVTLYPVWKQLYTYTIAAPDDGYKKGSYGWQTGTDTGVGSSFTVYVDEPVNQTQHVFEAGTVRFTACWHANGSWSGSDHIWHANLDGNYTFLGWTDSPKSSEIKYHVNASGYIEEQVIFENDWTSGEMKTTLTLYPVFQYHIRLNYNANGGAYAGEAPENKDSVYYHWERPTSETFTVTEIRPTRDDFLFVGWSTSNGATTGAYGYPYPNETGTLEEYSLTRDLAPTVTLNSSTTLYAVWWASYWFNYDGMGATADIPGSDHEYVPSVNTETYTLSDKVPVREGFTFMGWSTDSAASPDATDLIQPHSSYSPAKSSTGQTVTTFYAIWKEDTDGTAGTNGTNGLLAAANPLAVRSLAGVQTTELADTEQKTADYYFTAHDLILGDATQTLHNGDEIVQPEDPVTAEDEVFEGWFTAKDDGEYQLFITDVDEDGEIDPELAEFDADTREVVIYAKFGTPKRITYYYTARDVILASQTVKDGDMLLQPANPTVFEGEQFEGWFLPDGTQLFTDKDDDGEIDAEVVTVTEDSQDVTVWAVFEEEKEEQSSESEEDESGQAGQGESGNDKPTEEASEEKSGGETPVGEQGSGQTDPSTGGENTAQEKQEDQTNGVSNQTDQSGNGTDGKSETPKEDPVNQGTDPVTDPVTEPTTPTQDENQGTTEEEAGEPANGGEDEGNGDEEESITQGSADDPENPEQQNEVDSGDPPVDDTPPAEQPEGGTPEGGEGA